ncbi:flagellar hook-basal body complex protein [Oribacterium sp. P6A1]|uniref:flagellar hook-basal body complex protein n=1 Tax=Oribacterium sp. P6A1 TaxID=1410612 RepID=UPI00055AE663|nr:flagellar hook-basal body complex protein [Oribacterium sp. P6A1]
MLRAMDSAVAGLRSHQNKLDVISNNIANVNTYGFKSQSYSFKDTMYQTSTASAQGKQSTTTAGQAVEGGLNGAQYGYGSLTGSIATDFTSSTPSYIGGFNACINGSGFFITNSSNETAGITIKPKDDSTTTTNMKDKDFAYTRVGQFKVDSNGYIVDSNGNFVYGYRPNTLVDPTAYGAADENTAKETRLLYALRAPNETITDFTQTSGFSWEGTAIQLKSIEIGNDGIIKGVIEHNSEEKHIVIGKVAIASFQNQEGLMKAGNNTFNAAPGDNTGKVTVTLPKEGATPSLMAGYLEGSNVDLAKEFSDMITTQRGFQANSKIITVSDEVLQELVNMKR